MPAVVRVKRRIDEEPLGAFVLNGKKRRRLQEVGDQQGVGGKDEISTVLKFAGTINEQDDTATTQLARLTKEAAKELVQQKTRKPSNHTERARQEMRQSLHENRFRVVNCLRTTLEDEPNASNAKEITILDIEKQHVTELNSNEKDANNSGAAAAGGIAITNINDARQVTTESQQQQQQQREQQQITDSDTGYVYDLYLPENEQQAEYVDLMDDNYLSVRPFDDLFYEDRFNNADDDDIDSEDSNQENYFTNDYPDEDEYGEAGEYGGNEDESTREMRQAVENFVFEDDDESDEYYQDNISSDDEDCNPFQDPYVHTIEGNEDFVDDVDKYGIAYARYKKRIKKEMMKNRSARDEVKEKSDDEFYDSEKHDLDSSNECYHSASENEEYYK